MVRKICLLFDIHSNGWATCIHYIVVGCMRQHEPNFFIRKAEVGDLSAAYLGSGKIVDDA